MKRVALSIALLAFVASGCSKKTASLEGRALEWSAGIAKAAGEVVDDPERAKRATLIADQLTAELELFYDAIRSAQVRMAELNVDYDADRSDFDAALEDLRDQRAEQTEAMIALAMDMRGTMTADEWATFAAKIDPLD